MNNQELIDYIHGYFSLRQHSNVVIGDDKKDRIYLIALAAMTAEPIAVTDKSEVDGLSEEGWVGNFLSPEFKGVDKGDEVYLYTAPPVPFVVKRPAFHHTSPEIDVILGLQEKDWEKAIKAAGGSVADE